MNTKVQFIKIQDKRYRLATIKMYEPFLDDGVHGIYIYFSMSGRFDRRYHRFSSKKAKDLVLNRLDETFNIKY